MALDYEQCPNCGSDDTMEYDDGYICRDCGNEFGTNPFVSHSIFENEEEEQRKSTLKQRAK